MSKEELKPKTAELAEKYSKDISSKEDLVQEWNKGSQCQFCWKTVGNIGTVKCFGRVQIKKYISQPRCQFEVVPYSSSHNSISRNKLQQAKAHQKLSQVHHGSRSPDKPG